MLQYKTSINPQRVSYAVYNSLSLDDKESGIMSAAVTRVNASEKQRERDQIIASSHKNHLLIGPLMQLQLVKRMVAITMWNDKIDYMAGEG